MKRTKEEAALTRQAVLEAALKVFARKGFAQTGLEEVAKEAGFTRGAVYWHFGNKYEMFQAVLQECYERAGVRINRVLDSDQRPFEKIRQLMREIFLIISNEEEFSVIEELQKFKFEKRKELKDLYNWHLEIVKTMRGMIKDLIQEGIAVGDFDSTLDPDITTLALISYIAGMKSAWLSGIRDISIAENAGKLADIFINGIDKD